MENYLDKPLKQYLDDAAAKTATPGGGSVTALVGALATTMATMAANFTTGKEQYAQVEPQVQDDLLRLEEVRRKFLDLMQRDMAAYATVLAAYKLPKTTEAERQTREAAVQEALWQAAQVPLEAAQVAMQTLEVAGELGKIANANLLSDVAVAAILAAATFEASRVNVEVNLKSLADRAVVERTRRELDVDAARVAKLKDECLEAIRARSK